MSGDVQPRKRKDKRRKKEGSSLGNIHEPISSHKFKRSESDDRKIFDVPDQGEKIHVQNEHGMGGNICVKIIFFCLFGLLIGAVGLIYMKSLGSTDVDLPTIEESRFAEYFTGWLDEGTDDHEHEVENSVDKNVFEHEHDDHEDHDDHDDFDNHEQEGHDDEEHENEDQPSVQDSIYKLFGLQTDELEEAEENDKLDKVIENVESGIMQDVEEDEEDSEEKEEDNEDEEDEKEEGKYGEEEDDEEDGKYREEEDDEEDGKYREEEDDEEDGKYGQEESEEGEEEDENKIKEEDRDEVADNDSGVDLGDQDNSENEKNDDEDEDDLSQVDEEDEDDNKSEEKKLTVNEQFDDNVDDDTNDNDDDVSDNKEEDEEYKNEPDQEGEEKNVKTEEEDDDLGYEEIDVSEEDLEENVDKQKSFEDVEEIEEKFIKGSDDEVENDLESKQVESEINENEEETEINFGGVAVKLGVGIALIIVAHLVLVKKWKSMTPPSDENASTEETASNKNEIENLDSSVEPVISRRQTLVPENVCLNTSYEEEMDDEEEDEENIEGEEYSEEECEDEFKTSGKWETFEKPSWRTENGVNDGDDENVDDEEYEEEEDEEIEDEQEVEEEEEEEEEEEDYEDDDEVDDENDFVEQKPAIVEEERQEEVKETTPAPPPRTKTRKGAQEVDEDFTNPSEEPTEVEETSQNGPTADDETNSSGPEELKAPEKKVGNEDEWAFRQELEFADEQFENNPKAAVEVYDKIIAKKPTMIRALIGRARALDHWAEKEKSNAYLKQAIVAYKMLLLNHSHLLDDETYVKLAERCIERMRFAGVLVSAIDIHKALILKYPNIPKYRNALAVTYLMLNKIPQARVLLNETLSLWPEDGFALVHYGFILKTSDNNMEEGAKKLMAGIQTKQEGVIDGMFFFHLGDALNRLGREQEAMKWYELGVKEGLFLSKYQRSLYNVNRLKGQPWWTKEETTYQDFFKKLEENWREIRKEGLELLNSKGVNLFKEEAENLKDTGDWKQLDLYFRGRKQANCNKAPITCSLVSSFKPASTCTRGQIKFSVMFPNTHVWPHCGPTNCRLRSHLGLVVPKKTFIRVAEETRSWEEGKFIVFDDSFEHEVWHNGTGPRLVLIVDVWHPELTNHERRYLSPI